MAHQQITLHGRPLSPHKAVIRPAFKSSTVLVQDTWDYVDMWLRRNDRTGTDAALYWTQARSFYNAALGLPSVSSPLPYYYCFLNATKALLQVRGVAYDEYHGVTGESQPGQTALVNEIVRFRKGGVLRGLCQYFGETPAESTHNVKDMLYNLPYVHRAHNLTYDSQPELFIPISAPKFVRRTRATDSWFCAEVTKPRYVTKHTLKKLPSGYSGSKPSSGGALTIRCDDTFEWRYGRKEEIANVRRLVDYHREVRRNFCYIRGANRLWYMKRSGVKDGPIARSPLTLTFAAMHRLSELARYDSPKLARHLDSQHNWLLSEFLGTAPCQFIDQISSEITGQEFMASGWAVRD